MSLADQIYEAAFIPELWPEILGRIAKASGANSGALLVIDSKLPPLFSSTPNVRDALQDFSQTRYWYENPPAHRLQSLRYPGFLERADFFKPDEVNNDNPYHHNMVRIGADWQVGSIVDMPDGEMVLFTFERNKGLPDFDPENLALLDSLRPHLARASLMASRLKLEQAQASVRTFEALGIPAAVVASDRRVISTNALFETLGGVLRPAAFNRLSALDRNADALLRAALPGEGAGNAPDVRSIPMQLTEGRGGIVVHVMPLVRSASDIFDRGAAVIAVTGYSLEGNVPPEALLRGLFDLSVAEAKLAAGIAAGQTLAEIARQRGIAMTTARTHLAQVFRKTGTTQQAQLVALLKGVGAPNLDI